MAGTSAMTLAGLDRLNASVYREVTDLEHLYPQERSPDGVYWEALQKFFLCHQDGLIMMNNGTVGPMPEPVFNTLTESFRIQATRPCDVYNYFPTRREEVKRNVARFVGADLGEIAITRNTTEGMNFVANGLRLEPGDEVLLSDMEHAAGTHPWRLQEHLRGIQIRHVPLGLPPESTEGLVRSFEEAITPRTKVISISHTVFISGLIAPVKELSQMAHRHGVLVLADSAHGPGMLNLDLHDMEVDFLAASPYKWLGAPTGCGILYARRDAQHRLTPTIASSGWDTLEDIGKLETLGQRADPLLFALGEAVEFQTVVGKDRIERRIRSLANYLKEELLGIPGVRLHTSQDPYLSAGLTAFSVEGVDPQTMVDYLRERYNIVIRTIGSDAAGTRGVRVSTHIFLSYNHVDKLLEGVNHLARRA